MASLPVNESPGHGGVELRVRPRGVHHASLVEWLLLDLLRGVLSLGICEGNVMGRAIVVDLAHELNDFLVIHLIYDALGRHMSGPGEALLAVTTPPRLEVRFDWLLAFL